MDLRECPNCGESERVDVAIWAGPSCDDPDFRQVECDACFTSGPRAGTTDEATSLWNALPRRDTEAQTTHSAECWRWHLDCAVAKVEAQDERLSLARRVAFSSGYEYGFEEGAGTIDPVPDEEAAWENWWCNE